MKKYTEKTILIVKMMMIFRELIKKSNIMNKKNAKKMLTLKK